MSAERWTPIQEGRYYWRLFKGGTKNLADFLNGLEVSPPSKRARVIERMRMAASEEKYIHSYPKVLKQIRRISGMLDGSTDALSRSPETRSNLQSISEQVKSLLKLIDGPLPKRKTEVTYVG